MIKTIIICDTCGERIELDGQYWQCKDAMKAAGFQNKKTGDKWEIKCEKCRKKNA